MTIKRGTFVTESEEEDEISFVTRIEVAGTCGPAASPFSGREAAAT
jgi:hypothetical protein